MRADRAEVSWDEKKSKWLVRIEVGEEVIRRHCDLPRDADPETIRTAAKKTLGEEGYEADGVEISVKHSEAA
jgi:hypothetical protein